MANNRPWRKRAKLKELDGGLTTSMCFAVVGNAEKFKPRFHAYKVFRLLKSLGVHAYPIAADLERLGRDKVYADLSAVPEKVDVVVPCLASSATLGVLQAAKQAEIARAWFQPRTLSVETVDFCLDNEIQIIDSCVLLYDEFDGLTRLINPCYWHAKTISHRKTK